MNYRGLREPKLRSLLHSLLLEKIYEPINAVFHQQLYQIIAKQTVYTQMYNGAFMYKGERYIQDEHRRQPRIVPRLVPNLHADMDAYLLEQSQINGYEKAIVSGFLSAALTAAKYPEDLLVLLPDCVHYTLREFIDGYPVDAIKVSPETVTAVQTQHIKGIELLKQRLIRNLLI